MTKARPFAPLAFGMTFVASIWSCQSPPAAQVQVQNTASSKEPESRQGVLRMDRRINAELTADALTRTSLMDAFAETEDSRAMSVELKGVGVYGISVRIAASVLNVGDRDRNVSIYPILVGRVFDARSVERDGVRTAIRWREEAHWCRAHWPAAVPLTPGESWSGVMSPLAFFTITDQNDRPLPNGAYQLVLKSGEKIPLEIERSNDPLASRE